MCECVCGGYVSLCECVCGDMCHCVSVCVGILVIVCVWGYV